MQRAAQLYVQALEWLCHEKQGARAAEVAAATAPIDNELLLHKQFISKVTVPGTMPAWDPSNTVLVSKLLAVLPMPGMLDSIHQGSYVELWALVHAFNFDCLIWSTEVDQNIWVRTGERMTDVAARQKRTSQPQILELVHRHMGITGHYESWNALRVYETRSV